MHNVSCHGQKKPLSNSLGFIPAVEVFNYMDCTGEANGNGEFEWLANQIMYHDELVKNVRKNLKFFGNPTLISSRPKHDIIESGDETTSVPPSAPRRALQLLDGAVRGLVNHSVVHPP